MSSDYLTNENYFNKQPAIESPLYDLQDVIQQYQSQPEILKLILTSKVEEDKRRAEEARLRAKEIDFYIQHNHPPTPGFSPPITPHLPSLLTDSKPEQEENKRQHSARKNSYKMLPSTQKTTTQHETSPYTIPIATNTQQTSSRPYYSYYHSSSSSMSSLSSEEEEESIDQRRNSAAAAMLAMGRNLFDEEEEEEQLNKSDEKLNSPVFLPDHYTTEDKLLSETNMTESNNSHSKARRRREMQAITKIVETREFPYIDNYFWKNNGNTVQKKTGCKSIYYKCSNSNKGCSVNKTVTARPNGEYLIKYRGRHLPECGRVERICDL
ncbi:MAG: hypothetical protein EXX96DRAFT_553533 [Benjaminiella poitrasii]|nr:MAG: hypothetical protein EXX96DRAFT_553533 [Benjaminiella poitrasii]